MLVSSKLGLTRLTTRLHGNRKQIAFKTSSANRSNSRSLLINIFGKGGHRTSCLNLDDLVLSKIVIKRAETGDLCVCVCVSFVDVFEFLR